MYAFVDLETTGLDPAVHDILEVGIVLENPETTLERVDFSLPVDLRRADAKALAVNHAVERAAELEAKQMPATSAAYMLTDKLAGAVFIGNNPQFDAAFLTEFLRKNGERPTWKYHLVDVKALAGMALGLKPPWSTDQLLSALGLDAVVAHTALADAEQAREWFYAAYHHRKEGLLLP